ncbi:MAG: GNAT family N-acetyltransferase [Bacteroides sp.]|nr:GNAT family N-acetyltransferase [Bacteroides sp.]
MKSGTITIRKGTVTDIDGIMTCYETARKFMRESGNHTQWINGYPSRELVAEDIADGKSYVGVDEEGEIAMAFTFIIGDDPTYSVIEDGEWPDNLPYGTIHRLGSSGKHHGMLRICTDFCLSKIGNIRLDTHADNSKMQHTAEKLGFKRCGIIYCFDGSPRIAYQKSI